MDWERAALPLLAAAAAARLAYVPGTPYTCRQHDGAGHVNYITYLVKDNFRIPALDYGPRTIPQFYHLPLHYLLSAMWIKLQMLFGTDLQQGLESVQALTLLWPDLGLLFSWRLFKALSLRGGGLFSVSKTQLQDIYLNFDGLGIQDSNIFLALLKSMAFDDYSAIPPGQLPGAFAGTAAVPVHLRGRYDIVHALARPADGSGVYPAAPGLHDGWLPAADMRCIDGFLHPALLCVPLCLYAACPLRAAAFPDFRCLRRQGESRAPAGVHSGRPCAFLHDGVCLFDRLHRGAALPGPSRWHGHCNGRWPCFLFTVLGYLCTGLVRPCAFTPILQRGGCGGTGKTGIKPFRKCRKTAKRQKKTGGFCKEGQA